MLNLQRQLLTCFQGQGMLPSRSKPSVLTIIAPWLSGQFHTIEETCVLRVMSLLSQHRAAILCRIEVCMRDFTGIATLRGTFTCPEASTIIETISAGDICLQDLVPLHSIIENYGSDLAKGNGIGRLMLDVALFCR